MEKKYSFIISVYMLLLTLVFKGKVRGLMAYAEKVVLIVRIYSLASFPLFDIMMHRKKYSLSVKS
jgi:hypothetical protein